MVPVWNGAEGFATESACVGSSLTGGEPDYQKLHLSSLENLQQLLEIQGHPDNKPVERLHDALERRGPADLPLLSARAHFLNGTYDPTLAGGIPQW